MVRTAAAAAGHLNAYTSVTDFPQLKQVYICFNVLFHHLHRNIETKHKNSVKMARIHAEK
jgi:hypothetical protein